MPVRSLMTEDMEVQGDDCERCAICLEQYKVSDILRSLPCRHNFHVNCIDPWLLDQHTCPLCKMNIVDYYGFEQLEVEEARSRALSARNRHPHTLSSSDNSYEEAGSERSSGASSPDELPARTCDSPRHVSRSCTSSPSGSPRAETSRQEAASSSTAQE